MAPGPVGPQCSCNTNGPLACHFCNCLLLPSGESRIRLQLPLTLHYKNGKSSSAHEYQSTFARIPGSPTALLYKDNIFRDIFLWQLSYRAIATQGWRHPNYSAADPLNSLYSMHFGQKRRCVKTVSGSARHLLHVGDGVRWSWPEQLRLSLTGSSYILHMC